MKETIEQCADFLQNLHEEMPAAAALILAGALEMGLDEIADAFPDDALFQMISAYKNEMEEGEKENG